ncbi:unnamed protein product [Rotaria sp. Silwood2]|nr:unnamed protein product [Rotaria sp. Silwood2]
MWMQEALDRFDRENNDESLNDIPRFILPVQQGNIMYALVLTEQILAIDPDHVKAKNNKIYYESLIQNQSLVHDSQTDDLVLSNMSDSTVNNVERSLIQNDSNESMNFQVKNQRPGNNLESLETYEKLCRQKHAELSPKRQARLFCRYRHNNHPYLILGPVKEEQLLDEPAIFLFHDIVTIQFIRRSCQIFCFRSGNRIATWLTYLSDVELGGATVFPMVDGYIVPKKGSAAFWYNLYASGEGMIFLRFIALN